MNLAGTVSKGVVVPDEPDKLAEGMRVQIVVEEPVAEPSLRSLLDLAGTVSGLPSDLAKNHDHYLHGLTTK
jgi:hypothetical protein